MQTRNQIWLFATLFVSLCKLNLMAACNPPDQIDCCVIIPSNGCSRLGEFVLPTPEPKCVYLPSDNAPLEVCVGVSPIITTNGRILKIKRKVPSFPGANCESAEQIEEIDERHTLKTAWIAIGPNMVTNGLGNPACFTVTNTGIYTVTFTVTMEEQCVTNPVKTVDVQVNVGVIDLDIDSDHSNGDFGPANGDAAEDTIEDDFPGKSPNEGHKYVLVNNYHEADGYVPGYANFNLEAPLAPANIAFTPLTVKVQPCDHTAEAAQNLYVTFTYSDSDPNNITSNRMITGDWEWPVPQGDLRLWTKDITQERNPASILDGGDFIPAGVRIPAEQLDLPGEKIIFIEGVRPACELGASAIQMSVERENAALCDTCSDIVRCTPIQVNVDIDNFNDSGYAVAVRERFGEDHYEDYIDGTNHIGRVIVVNDDDMDNDGIPGFADGYGLFALPEYQVSTNSQFVPLIFELPAPIDLERAKIKLTYDASDPMGVTTNELGDFLLPDSGKLRIWTKDGNKRRNGKSVIAGGDFLDVGEYSATAFGFTNESSRILTYYVETVKPSDEVGDLRILFEVQPDERAGFMAADVVRVTPVEIGFIDDYPDYSLYSNEDSDNFFLREHNESNKPDNEDLEIYYKILPEDLPVTNVVIKIYRGDSDVVETNLIGKRAGNGKFATGKGLLVKWTASTDLEERHPGFYRLQLEVCVSGCKDTPIYKTPVNDADAKTPGWQCPQKGLAIHDLVWKHRPILHVHEDEIGLPSSIMEFMIESGDSTGPRVKEWTGSKTPTVHPVATIPTSINSFWDLFFDNKVTKGDSSDYTALQIAVLSTDTGEETVYHSANVADANTFVFLQFWMFENFSRRPFGILGMPFDPNVQHEGDVEYCQIAVRLADHSNASLKAKWVTPFGATASQHYYAQTLKWDLNDGAASANAHSQEHVEHVGGRLAIYVALGSHATYFVADADIEVPDTSAHLGTQQQYDPIPDGAYDISAPAYEVDYKLLHIDDTLLGTFNGRWGYLLNGKPGSFSNGPSGPPHRSALDESGEAVNLRAQPRVLHNLSRKTSQVTEMYIP